MKILHVSNTDIRSDNRIIKELESLIFNPNYKVYAIGVDNVKDAVCVKINNKINIKSLGLFSNILSFFPRTLKYFFVLTELNLKLFYKGLKLKPDLVHCHDTMVLPAGFFLKIFTNTKLIYDAHELESNKNGQSKILSRATLFIEQICWRKVDHLITVSDSIIGWYEEKLGFKPNTIILNSPSISEVGQKSEKYFHQLYEIPEENLVFVYLGIFGSGRGIDYILDAFSKKNIKSHVVFIGYGKLESKIKDFSETNTNIHYHKAVAHEKVVPLVKNADVGLCLIENISLSDYYCLPNKLFEYAFAKLPILASDFPDISTVVNKFSLGEVCAINSKSINRAVYEMELNPPKSITADLDELGWAEQAKKLNQTYFKLLKK